MARYSTSTFTLKRAEDGENICLLVELMNDEDNNLNPRCSRRFHRCAAACLRKGRVFENGSRLTDGQRPAAQRHLPHRLLVDVAAKLPAPTSYMPTGTRAIAGNSQSAGGVGSEACGREGIGNIRLLLTLPQQSDSATLGLYC